MSDVLDVTVTREDGFWVAVVEGVRGGATEVRRLANLEPEVRDLLSGLLDVEPDAVQLRFHLDPALSAGAVKALHNYDEAATAYRRAQAEYEVAQREAVAELKAAEVSLRDAGHLTGLSFQRVQQLQAR